MKKLILVALVLLAGCGDPNYVEQPLSKSERAMMIATGKIQPTVKDYEELDVAPVINGISKPDGVIDTGDAVALLHIN